MEYAIKAGISKISTLSWEINLIALAAPERRMTDEELV
jgi:hypothetical protein